MHWLIAIGAFISLVVGIILLLIFLPKPTVFFEADIEEIKSIKHEKIKEECRIDEKKEPIIAIYGNEEWKIDGYSEVCRFLETVPGLVNAGIINIKPCFEEVKQYGYADIANETVRYFYTIEQSAAQKSGIWIDGSKKFFCEKEWICGDMSREHSLFNKNKHRSTVVLFMDVERSPRINIGNSPNKNIEKDEILRMFM